MMPFDFFNIKSLKFYASKYKIVHFLDLMHHYFISYILNFNFLRSLIKSSLISGASFFGNGFIKLRMGNFSVRNYSRIEFEFRTLQKNGTLFAVQSASNVRSHLIYHFIICIRYLTLQSF